MELKDYVRQAIVTESRIPTFAANQADLLPLLGAFINAGNLIDIVKKDVYYGIPTDPQKKLARELRWGEHVCNLEINVDEYLNAPADGEPTPIHQIDTRIAHAIIGLATEAVELVEALHTAICEDKPIDRVNLLEELGDINWYHAILIDALGADWNNVLDTNIAKLRARYSDKFSAAETTNRDLDAERALLEAKLG